MVWGWALWAGIVVSAQAQWPSMSEEEINFLFSVKQVDEFMERFNHQPTLFTSWMNRMDSSLQVSRQRMILSLFNQEDQAWNLNQVRSFVEQVDDSLRPAHLDYYDHDWYADLECLVQYQGKPRTVHLLLRVQAEPINASRWVIAGAQADFLTVPASVDSTTSLTPFSHGTDFMNLTRALHDRQNIRNYLPQEFEVNTLSVFTFLSATGQLEFKQVNRIVYHFLQVEGWIFTVDHFNRPSRNSGWLISSLQPADAAAKQRYRHEVLSLQ
ncbi:hypothetical protein SAMN05421823_105179 [Catalinimonas alkaloidigena]|uniref:Uncharacterized protein n=2 Tax=Catalinimonas alkaloidigena TaxID=1075417 RepID=A0A1G9J285_9BACT|nr:hypothetical protein SAMN05421823_105179 [Catalinimonas alkaloidigena]